MKNQIYLISLEKDSERRRELEKTFPKKYSSFIRINAILGKELSAGEYFEFISPFFRRSRSLITPSELGATLSHLDAVEKFLESDSDFALILEDDISGDDKAIDEIFSLIEKIPENSFLLCGMLGREWKIQKFRRGEKVKGTEQLYRVIPESYHNFYGAYAYALTKSSAKRIAQYHKDCLRRTDYWGEIFEGSKIDIYYADMIRHPELLDNSNINPERWKAQYQPETSILKITTAFTRRFFKSVKRRIRWIYIFLKYDILPYSAEN